MFYLQAYLWVTVGVYIGFLLDQLFRGGSTTWDEWLFLAVWPLIPLLNWGYALYKRWKRK